MKTPSREAREAKGLTPKAAARIAGICPEYLLRLERTEEWKEWHARVLARAYGVGMQTFLKAPKPKTTSPKQPKPGRAGRGADARKGSGDRYTPAPRAGE